MTSDNKKHTRPLVPKEPLPEENEEIITPVREPSTGRDSAEEIREALDEEISPEAEGEKTDAEHVTIPLKEYAGQLKQIDMFKAMADEFKDGWQRERAEFSNYRKLVERTASDERQNRTVEVIKKYLVILDDLERALKTRPTEGPAGEWSAGVELVVRKLQNILDCEGVKRIPAENEAFDPMRHEAISHEESPDHKSGQIIEVVQQGYTIGDRVLRPAQVRVAR
jgi:molecular chaperone GrpE